MRVRVRLGLIVRGVDQGPLAALSGVGAAALVLALLFRPWQAGGLGGGDVKLAAATAAWVSFGQLVWFALATGLAGGAVALVCYLLSRAPRAGGDSGEPDPLLAAQRAASRPVTSRGWRLRSLRAGDCGGRIRRLFQSLTGAARIVQGIVSR